MNAPKTNEYVRINGTRPNGADFHLVVKAASELEANGNQLFSHFRSGALYVLTGGRHLVSNFGSVSQRTVAVNAYIVGR